MITLLGIDYASGTYRTRWFVGDGGTLSLVEVYKQIGKGHAWCIVSAELHEARP